MRYARFDRKEYSKMKRENIDNLLHNSDHSSDWTDSYLKLQLEKTGKLDEPLYSVPLSDIIKAFDLEVLHMPEGSSVKVSCRDVNRPGLPLAGFFDHFEAQRIQIIGKVEHLYLESLDEETRNRQIYDFISKKPVALIFSTSLSAFEHTLQYAKEFNCPEFWDETAKQAIIMYENMTNHETGLMHHAWDESRREEWADKKTGLSDETWGRAQGWYVVAIMDILSFIPENHPYRLKLINIEREILSNIMKYRDEKSKLWYQVVAKGNEKGNWIENSCSFLFITAIAKAVRLGVLDECYREYANECFEGALRNIDKEGDDLLINHVCIGTCIFDYQGYIDRPTSVNDLHGTGAFLLMCSEIARIN